MLTQKSKLSLLLIALTILLPSLAWGQTTITTQNFDGVTAPAIPTGWTVTDSNVVTSTTQFNSSPNSLHNTANNASKNAYYSTADTYGGDVQVTVSVKFTGTGINTVNNGVRLIARDKLTGSSFFVDNYNVNINPAIGVQLFKDVSSTLTQIGSTVGSSATFGASIWYTVQFTLQGTSLKAQIQRASDSKYLTSAAAWQSGQAYCINTTDSSVTGAGYMGFRLFHTDANEDDWLDDATLVGFASSAGVLSSTGQTQTTITLTDTAPSFGTSPYTYQLYRSTTANPISTGAQVGTTVPYTDTGLVPGKTYFYAYKVTDSLSATSNTSDLTQATTARTVAAHYYISAAGNDSNDGVTTGTPWLTIAAANNWFYIPGDTLSFRGGDTFTGAVLISQSGTNGSPILVNSYGTGQATISSTTSYGIHVLDSAYVTVDSLTFAGAGVPSNGIMANQNPGIWIDSTATQGTQGATRRNGLIVSNCTVGGFYVGIQWSADGGNLSTTYPVGFATPTTQNCTVTSASHCGVLVHGKLGAGMRHHSNVLVDHCTVSTVKGDSNVTTNHTGDGIIVYTTSGGQIQYCVVHDCGGNNSNAGAGPGGQWCLEASNFTIQYGESYNMTTGGGDGSGFDLDGGVDNSIIQYCYSHDNYGAGFMTGWFSGSNPTTANIIRFNVSQNDARKSLSALLLFGITSSIQFYHNTIYLNKTGVIASYTPPVFTNTGTATSATLRNNIFYCTGGASLNSNYANAGCTMQGNCYYVGGVSGNFSIFWNATTYSTMAAWQTGESQEKNGATLLGVVGDPLFVNGGAGGTINSPDTLTSALTAYKLTLGSAAANVGLVLTLSAYGSQTLTRDFRNSIYPLGLPEIGAFEFGGLRRLKGARTGSRSAQ